MIGCDGWTGGGWLLNNSNQQKNKLNELNQQNIVGCDGWTGGGRLVQVSGKAKGGIDQQGLTLKHLY